VAVPTIKYAFISLGIVAFSFWVMDWKVTGWFWHFNPRYVSGFYILNLPIEEILFFITVPYSCLFLWVNVRPKIRYQQLRWIPPILILTFVLLLLNVAPAAYTTSILILLALTILLDLLLKTNLFMDNRFLLFLMIVTMFTFIFNWYLTARPVVIYEEMVKTNINILTIPIEDFIYGISLISLVFIIYERLTKN
jgi:lycopene cyclase domain-containing protein